MNDEKVCINSIIQEKIRKANEVSKKLINVTWQVEKVDFLIHCKENERNESRSLVKRITADIEIYCKKSEDILEALEISKSAVNKIMEEIAALQEKIDTVVHTKEDLISAIQEVKSHNNVLLKRNAALKLKLNKQNEEYRLLVEEGKLQLNAL